jgi:hypothetical protein
MMPKPSLGEVLQDGGARQRMTDALLSRAREKGTKVEYNEGTVGAHFDRAGDEGKPLVSLSKRLEGTDEGLSTLAHELGHAEFDKTTLGRVVQDGNVRAMSGFGPLIGMVIALIAEGNVARKATLSSLGVAASQAPLLAGEGVAWMKGHQMLKEHGATPDQLKHLRHEALRLGSTYLTPGAYGLGTALLTSAAHGASR